MTVEVLMILLCIIWFIFLLAWLLTKSVTIATLFFVIWISLRYVIQNHYLKEKESKRQ